jgi:ketosteroid isomerase-like protein
VRQQIEALIAKQDEAFNKNDAAGCTADYTQDAVEVLAWETAGGAASIIGPNDSLAPVRQNVYQSLGS